MGCGLGVASLLRSRRHRPPAIDSTARAPAPPTARYSLAAVPIRIAIVCIDSSVSTQNQTRIQWQRTPCLPTPISFRSCADSNYDNNQDQTQMGIGNDCVLTSPTSTCAALPACRQYQWVALRYRSARPRPRYRSIRPYSPRYTHSTHPTPPSAHPSHPLAFASYPTRRMAYIPSLPLDMEEDEKHTPAPPSDLAPSTKLALRLAMPVRFFSLSSSPA
ncbi:hypothetical protein B0H19DRAFT_578688 [Mycena capillaripes]|nr:hypothetical protein B0H19DRAFT_578688 [Mycena capillaripes]